MFHLRTNNIEHRLVYKTSKDTVFVAQCRYHY
ncbi:MAG: type II toxin-antitoxin system YoeB family toxin [Gammaproteobacteria bacterium]|nr:type II toxin-antitoxin system YoeB family toxin [Gammaproteobacteria bacterium]